MALIRSFRELVQKRVGDDPEFGAALLREGIDTLLAGDVGTGKAILRDYIKATVGFIGGVSEWLLRGEGRERS